MSHVVHICSRPDKFVLSKVFSACDQESSAISPLSCSWSREIFAISHVLHVCLLLMIQQPERKNKGKVVKSKSFFIQTQKNKKTLVYEWKWDSFLQCLISYDLTFYTSIEFVSIDCFSSIFTQYRSRCIGHWPFF